MNCEEAEELLASYALDALPPEEAERLRAHLAGCDRHARSLAELRSVASSLALADDAAPAPRGLRASIVRAAMETPQIDRGPVRMTSRPAVAEAAGRRPAAKVNWRAAAKVNWFPLAAAAAIIVALATWNVMLQTSDDDGGLSGPARVAQVESTGGGTAFVAYFPESERALLVAEGMAALDEDEATYQLWSIVDGDVESLGLLEASEDGRLSETVELEARDGRILAVTIEPPGGSAQPTSDPIMRAEL